MAYSLAALYEDRDFMCELKICKTCGDQYKTVETLGKLQCRYHPGWIEEDEREVRRYHCCGQPLDARDPSYNRLLQFGCTPADHTILNRAYEAQDNLELLQRPDPEDHYRLVQFDPNNCRYSVWRYDFQQADYRLRYGTYNAVIAARFRAELQAAMEDEEEGSSDSEFALIQTDDEEEDDDETESEDEWEEVEHEAMPLFIDND